jgi:hypothetical protein
MREFVKLNVFLFLPDNNERNKLPAIFPDTQKIHRPRENNGEKGDTLFAFGGALLNYDFVFLGGVEISGHFYFFFFF